LEKVQAASGMRITWDKLKLRMQDKIVYKEIWRVKKAAKSNSYVAPVPMEQKRNVSFRASSLYIELLKIGQSRQISSQSRQKFDSKALSLSTELMELI
jgi:hypothetical protein